MISIISLIYESGGSKLLEIVQRYGKRSSRAMTPPEILSVEEGVITPTTFWQKLATMPYDGSHIGYYQFRFRSLVLDCARVSKYKESCSKFGLL